MMHWHRCRRWWRHGLECPFNSLVQHEPDDEGDPPDEPEPIGVIPPGKKRVDKTRKKVEKVKRPADNLTDEELAELGGHVRRVVERNRKIQEEAEKVIDEVPRPIPNTLEPVGDISPFLPPPPVPRGRPPRPVAATAAQDARVVSEEEEVKGKTPTLSGALARAPVPKSVGLAAALTMNQITRLHPQVDLPRSFVNEAAERAIVEEFVKAPKPSGFGFKAKRIGFIVGGAAAGIGAAIALGRGGGGGGGGFAFNAAQRLRGQLTTGAFP